VINFSRYVINPYIFLVLVARPVSHMFSMCRIMPYFANTFARTIFIIYNDVVMDWKVKKQIKELDKEGR
jgi:hypothetical protein